MADTTMLTPAPTCAVWLTGWVAMLGAVAKVLTVRSAALLVAEPALLVAITVYEEPLSPVVTPVRVRVDAVAPAMFTPPFCHWYVGAGEPLAVAAKEALPPAKAVWFAG